MDIGFLIKGLVIAAVTIGGLATTVIFKMKPDNTFEQVAEDIIKNETGADVDLTPEDK